MKITLLFLGILSIVSINLHLNSCATPTNPIDAAIEADVVEEIRMQRAEQ